MRKIKEKLCSTVKLINIKPTKNKLNFFYETQIIFE